MLLWLALTAVAAPPSPIVSPRALAPDFAYFESMLEEAESTLTEVDALGATVALLHNRWAERQSAIVPCDDAEARALAARAPVFGAAYRDAVQTARARSARLMRVVVAPVSTPLLGLRDRERAERVVDKTRAAARNYLEAATWQSMHLTSWTGRCHPVLTPGPGLMPRAPRPPQEAPSVIAIIGIGGGRVCPIDRPANGTAVMAPQNVACIAAERCDCTPRPVLPGAVLGL